MQTLRFSLLLLLACAGVSQASPQEQTTLKLPSSGLSQVAPSPSSPPPESPQPFPAAKSDDTLRELTPGTITVKPLSVTLSALTFGMRKKNLRVNQFDIDSHRSSFGYMANRAERAGVGYDLEVGIMASPQVELFTVLGFSYERPFEKVTLSSPASPLTTLNADFKIRRTWEVSLGGRYYWDLQGRWSPFAGILGTRTSQDALKADIYQGNAPNYVYRGSLTLQDQQKLWGGAIQAGADYHFNPTTSLSFSMSLRYTARTSRTDSTLAGYSFSTRDNRSLWSLPVTVSLKFMI